MKTQILLLRETSLGLAFAGSMESDPTPEQIVALKDTGLIALKLINEYNNDPIPPITGVEDLTHEEDPTHG